MPAYLRPMANMEGGRPVFDPGAEAFVSWLRKHPDGAPWSANDLWMIYADWYSDRAALANEPLTRLQLFRRIGSFGLRCYREPIGDRPRRYRFDATGDRRRS